VFQILFKTILDSIETVLKANQAANTLIKVYRQYIIEPGVHTVPACVIGSTRAMKIDDAFTGDTGGARPRTWDVDIGVSLITRRYPLPAQVKTAAEEVDATQAAVYTALNADSSLGNVVEQSWVETVREIILLQGEYYGYEILLSCQVFEV
jgi:hypothetical protein